MTFFSSLITVQSEHVQSNTAKCLLTALEKKKKSSINIYNDDLHPIFFLFGNRRTHTFTRVMNLSFRLLFFPTKCLSCLEKILAVAASVSTYCRCHLRVCVYVCLSFYGNACVCVIHGFDFSPSLRSSSSLCLYLVFFCTLHTYAHIYKKNE